MRSRLSLALFTVLLAGCGSKPDEAAPASSTSSASTAAPAPATPSAASTTAPTTPTGDASNGGMQSVKPGEAGSR